LSSQRALDCRLLTVGSDGIRVSLSRFAPPLSPQSTVHSPRPLQPLQRLQTPDSGLQTIYGVSLLASRGNMVARRIFSMSSNRAVIRSSPIARPPWGGSPALWAMR